MEEGIVPGGVSLLHAQQAVADLLDPLNMTDITSLEPVSNRLLWDNNRLLLEATWARS